jgi:hypothetical protein
MKRLCIIFITAHLLYAPACFYHSNAGTLPVTCDPITWPTPVQYEFTGMAPQAGTSALVPVPDCADATVEVRAIVTEGLSVWSDPLTAWPSMTAYGAVPTEINLALGEMVIEITGNNFPPDVDVQAGRKGDLSWQSTFTESDRTCDRVVGLLKLADTATSGMAIDLTLVSEDQSVLAGTVIVTVSVVPAPTGLRVVR